MKNHCEYLSKQMNEGGTDSDKGKSILAYDDIEAVCLPGKIEAYFQETNKIFTSRFSSAFDQKTCLFVGLLYPYINIFIVRMFLTQWNTWSRAFGAS